MTSQHPKNISVIVLLFGMLCIAPLAFAAEEGTTPPTDATNPTPEESYASTYDFKNEGIFGCNQIAGASASAGTMAAIGGVYVPVNDAAVTLNTGILVYKECVLRPLQVRLREAATSQLQRKNIYGIQTGRDGNPQYLVNIRKEQLAWRDKSRITTLKGKTAEAITPAFKNEIIRSDAFNYRQETRAPEYELTCPYSDIASRLRNESEDSMGSILALADQSCIPHLNAIEFKELADSRDAQAIEDCMTQLEWGRGYHPKTDDALNCLAQKVSSPAALVQESFQTVFDSPVHQLEQANDVGQIIGALFSSVTTQALTDPRGLAGLTQTTAGRPSYLDQIARESSQGVVGAAVNAALTILSAARQTEASFLAAMNAIAANLTQTINQLRQTERNCWALIVPKAREQAARGTCTVIDPNTNPPTEQCSPFTLDERKINASTSTLAFAQQIIDSQITPLANVALSNVQASERALALIDQLITSVTSTTSVTTQRLALQQLDTLVAEKRLHTQYDVTNAAKQRDDIGAAMTTLLQDTAVAWGDSPDAAVGWCNVNNSAVIQLWAERWKK